MKLPKFEKDSSYRSRGGSAQWLLLLCGVCKEPLAFYQKDGPGKLHRLYLDRLADSKNNRPLKSFELDKIQKLNCFVCDSVIGVPMLYEKDVVDRPAVRLVDAGIDKVRLVNMQQWDSFGNIDITQTLGSMIIGEVEEF
jgi:hypothetical protein